MVWIYSQSSGQMSYEDGNGSLNILAKGYSGRGSSENNPDDQCLSDFGPLPRGNYTFGPLIHFNHMDNCLQLTPDVANDMCGRAGFLIHDGVSFGPHGSTSHGCICLPTAARIQMAQSGDINLRVIQ